MVNRQNLTQRFHKPFKFQIFPSSVKCLHIFSKIITFHFKDCTIYAVLKVKKEAMIMKAQISLISLLLKPKCFAQELHVELNWFLELQKNTASSFQVFSFFLIAKMDFRTCFGNSTLNFVFSPIIFCDVYQSFVVFSHRHKLSTALELPIAFFILFERIYVCQKFMTDVYIKLHRSNELISYYIWEQFLIFLSYELYEK